MPHIMIDPDWPPYDAIVYTATGLKRHYTCLLDEAQRKHTEERKMIDPFAGRVDGFGQTYADLWAKAERKYEERKMSDTRERWLNVAQAAQWLAEGKAVEVRNPNMDGLWRDAPPNAMTVLATTHEYRLKPEPPKPREWTIFTDQDTGYLRVTMGPPSGRYRGIHVREVVDGQ